MVTEANIPELRVKPVKIKTGLPPIRLAVYGEGGCGKTTLGLSFPNPIVIDTDGGLEGDAVIGANGEEWRPETWRDLNALYFWLKEQIKTKGYQTIVLDSISELAVLILHESMSIPTKGRAAAAENSELISAEQQDYGRVNYALDNFLTKLKLLSKSHGVHIVITSGVREKDIEKSRMKRTFDVQPAVEGALTYWANVYGELEVFETPDPKNKEQKIEERVLWTRVSDPHRKNKTRFGALRPGVKDPTFTKIAGLITSSQKGEAK